MIKNNELNEVLEYANKNNISDIHIVTNKTIYYRDNSGDIITIDGTKIISKEDTIKIIKEISGEEGYEYFLSEKELDISYSYKEFNRYRINCYMDSNGYSLAFRLIPNKVPTMQELGLGEQIKELCDKNKGLILVTGPTGSGKSTNMAAMIDYINKTKKKHIITIEDPIEFSFENGLSLINQRELGNHTNNFPNALRGALREDPDVIMLGEMRDPETIKMAITLAETGHLVISTLHTNDSVQTIDRMVDVFPGNMQTQIRMQLSQSLAGIISQRLLPRIDKVGRIASREILITNDAIRNLIIKGQTHQIYSVLEIGKNMGMILMDKYLLALYNKKIISKDTLMSSVRDKESISLMIN